MLELKPRTILLDGEDTKVFVREPDYDSNWFNIETGKSYELPLGFMEAGMPRYVMTYYKINDRVYSLNNAGVLLDISFSEGKTYVMTNETAIISGRFGTKDGEIVDMTTTTCGFRLMIWKMNL